MNHSEWREFLKLFSKDFLSHDWTDTTALFASHGTTISDEARRMKWMGYEPAAEAEIVAAENRLGRRLPISIRTFYGVSNGWGMVSSSVFEILPVQKFGWLKDLDPHLYGLACKDEDRIHGRPFKRDPDNSRLKQHCLEQGTMVKRSLAITPWGDAARWLLDPGPEDHGGEWRGGTWASWIPAMEWSADSFADLMRRRLESNRQMK